MRNDELDLDEAIDMTGLDAEDLMTLASDGTLKAKTTGGQTYFEGEPVEQLIDRMIDIGRSGGDQFSLSNLRKPS
jgi:hypothetical protein